MVGVLAALAWTACTETKTVMVDNTVPNTQEGTIGGNGAVPAPTTPSTETALQSSPPTLPASSKHDITPPLVASVNPANATTGASLSTEISATFTEDVAPETVTVDSFQVADSQGTAVAGVLSYDAASKVATFTPDENLLDGEYYHVTLTTGVKDLAGNAMQLPYSATWQTNNLKSIAVAAGQDHFLAVKENGSVWGWGRNQWGQLGDGTRSDRNRPVRVKGLENIKAVAAGISFSLALDNEGNVWAWGRNQLGQLGQPIGNAVLFGAAIWNGVPTQIAGLNTIVAIATGTHHALALTKDGQIYAWGANYYGTLGINGVISASYDTPTLIPTLTHVVQISAGASFSVALTQIPSETSHVWVWGNNSIGQLGAKTPAFSNIPIEVTTLPSSALQSIATGATYVLALTDKGGIIGWGHNTKGSVGTGAQAGFIPPSWVEPEPALPTDPYATQIGSGPTSYTSYSVRNDGSLWGWGENTRQQLMQMSASGSQMTPAQMGTLKFPIQVTGANINIGTTIGGVTMILKQDGSIAMVGYNFNGQLGNGSASYYSYKPNYMPNLLPAADVSGRSLVTEQGSVFVWGWNGDCQAGLPLSGNNGEVMTPTPIAIADVQKISHGQYHLLALKKDGSVWAWGRKSYGAAGAGVNPCVPTQILDENGTPLTNIIDVKAGWNLSLALRDNQNGTKDVLAWGDNSNGHLGLGTKDGLAHSNATKVPGLPSTIKSITTYQHDLAVTEDGKLWAWGGNANIQGNAYGEMGDGTQLPHYSPVQSTLVDNVDQAAVGLYHTLLLLKDKTVMSVGGNTSLVLGYSTPAFVSPTPQLIPGLSTIQSLVACGNDSAAVTADGTIYTWGDNLYGQLGLGSSIEPTSPALVPNPSATGNFDKVAQASCQGGVFVVRRTDGTIWEWGYDLGPLVRDGESISSGFPSTVNWP